MNSSNDKPLPHLDDSPELLALIDELVALRIRQGYLWWEKSTGKEADDARIQELSAEIESITRKIVECPFEPINVYQELFLSVQEQQFTDLNMRFVNYLNEGYICKEVTFRDKPITWNTWYPWLRSPAATDDTARKKVFDTFLSQVPPYKELLVENTVLFRELLDKLGINSDEFFASRLGIPLGTLRKYIETFLDLLKPHLHGLYGELTGNYFQRKPGYYDDAWTLVYAAYRDVERECPDFKSFVQVTEFCRKMGYDFTRLSFDTEQREKKYSLPFCQAVSIPNDIRVSVHSLKGFKTFVSLLHELGHAFHFSSIDPALPTYRRYYGSKIACIEVPSMLIGEYLVSLADVREWFLGKPSNRFIKAIAGLNKAELLLRALTAVQTLAYHVLYNDWSIDAVTEEYQRLLDNYFDIPLVAEFWYISPFMTHEHYLYSMGTVLSLVEKLASEYGDNWWKDPLAHGNLRLIWLKSPDFKDELPEPDPKAYARWLLANAGLGE